MDKHKLLIVTFISFIFLISIISATEYGYDTNKLSTSPTNTRIGPVNIDVNNTFYWQGYEPSTLPHNILFGIQGGSIGDYYHLTQASYNRVQNISYYVPYSGANQSVDLNNFSLNSVASITGPDFIQFNISKLTSTAEGKLLWDSDDGTLAFGMPGGNVNLQIGQESLILVKNGESFPILNGDVVYISGASGQRPVVKLADADNINTSLVLGVATEDINTQGYVTTQGLVRDLDTDHGGFTEGGMLWLSQEAGNFTAVRPPAPAISVFIGYVIYSHHTQGIIAVRPFNIPKMSGLSDTYNNETPNITGQFYTWNQTTKKFELNTISGTIGAGYVPYTGASNNVNLSSYNLTAANIFIPTGGQYNFQANETSNSFMFYNATDRRLELWVNGKIQQDWGNSTTIYGTATFQSDIFFKNMSGDGLLITTNVLVDGNLSSDNIFSGNICYADGTNCSYVNISIANLTNYIININQSLYNVTLTKLDITDQRYNDTLAIQNVNSSLYNYTYNVNSSLTSLIGSEVSGSGTNGTVPLWNGSGTKLGNSPIQFLSTDEDYMVIWNGTFYADFTNHVTGINVAPGTESHAQALQVNSQVQTGVGTIVNSSYNSTLNITLVNNNVDLAESFTDATSLMVAGRDYYVWRKINDTAFYISGQYAINNSTWTFQQAPYVDVNGPLYTERGYSISNDGNWSWAMTVPSTSPNDTDLCFQQSGLFFRGTTNAMCIKTLSGEPILQTTGGIKSGNSIYVGYGASPDNALETSTQPSGMFLPVRYVAVDSTATDDSGFVFGHNGLPVWDLSTFVGEKASYLHVGINYRSGDTALLLSEDGRMAENKPSNIMNYHSGFNGTGSNDMSVGGTYTGSYNDDFEIVATNATAFKWRVNINNLGFGTYSSIISMSTTPIEIYKGVTVKWDAITGHIGNDTWYFTAFAQNPQGTFTITPTSYREVVFLYNGVTFIDNTFEAATSLGIPFASFNTTNEYIYVARNVPTSTANFIVSTPATGLTLKVEYFNGTSNAWQALNSSMNTLIDGTINLTKTGVVSWDKSTIADWGTNVSVDTYNTTSGMYWMRFSTTTAGTNAPKLYALTPQGVDRLQVYQSRDDSTPVFSVGSNGDTVVAGTLKFNNFYGEMYNSSNGVLTMTTQNVWYNITGFTAGDLSGWSVINESFLNCSQPGLYQVSYMINGAVNNNDVLNYQILVNTTLEPKGDITMRYSTNLNNIITTTFLKRFNKGDVIYLQVRDTSRNNAVLTFDNKNIIVTRLGN